MILHHEDGRIEETDVRGDGAITIGSYWRLPAASSQWWKIVALRWYAGEGVAHLEPTELPPHLAGLEERR
jgi:hypothetical protein